MTAFCRLVTVNESINITGKEAGFMISEHRGRHMVKLSKKNLEKVRDFFKENPDAMMKDCEEATGLSPLTVRNHVKAIKKGY